MPFEIEYNSLKTHPLWIDEKKRENFLPMQIEKNSPALTIPKNTFLQKDPEAELFVNSSRTEGVLVKKKQYVSFDQQNQSYIFGIYAMERIKKRHTKSLGTAFS